MNIEDLRAGYEGDLKIDHLVLYQRVKSVLGHPTRQSERHERTVKGFRDRTAVMVRLRRSGS